jgi:hypothetical protein
VQIVRQVPMTLGGVGLIEIAFIDGLTAAGTDGRRPAGIGVC